MGQKVGVVIPAYRPGKIVLDVIRGIPSEVDAIYLVDDCCPEQTGKLVEESISDSRIVVLRNQKNLGVGGATVVGYQACMDAGLDICVKLDSDGQMNPEMIPFLVAPIALGEADYVKGNRFFSRATLRAMPLGRLIGNFALTLLTKASSGYWNVSDPTNGFTAISSEVLRCMELGNLSKGFFFESDLLFRLGTVEASVLEVPMEAKYSSEKSNLKPLAVIPIFLKGNLKNFTKRILYRYYLRGFSRGSLMLPMSVVFSSFALLYGAGTWYSGLATGTPTPTGTLLLILLAAIFGVQFFLDFLSEDSRTGRQPPLVSGSRTKLKALQQLAGGSREGDMD